MAVVEVGPLQAPVRVESFKPDQDGGVWGPECCGNVWPVGGRPRIGIRGYGNVDSGVVLVGIAPGRNEVRDGKPFVGKSGKLNDIMLKATGWDRKQVYATNLICWWKDEPTPDEIAFCGHRLKAELIALKPKLIVALGALATERLTGRKISKVRGNIIYPEWNDSSWFKETSIQLNVPVLCTWHPAAILRVPSMGADLVRDYSKIKRFMDGELHPPIWSHHLAETQEEAQLILDTCGKYGRAAIDVETENDEEDAFARVISLAVAIKVEHGQIHTGVIPAEFLHGLTWPEGVKWGFHNGQFDTQAIKRTLGFWLDISWDTMLLSYAHDERPGYEQDKNRRSGGLVGPGYHGLKQLSREWLGAGFYEEDVKGTLGKSLEQVAAPQEKVTTVYTIEEWEAGVDGWEILEQTQNPKGKNVLVRMREPKAQAVARFQKWLQDFYKYNALDAAHTVALEDRLGDGYAPCYERYLLPGANAYKEIQYEGIGVDEDRLDALIQEFGPRIETMRLDLQAQAHALGYRNPPKTASKKKLYLWQAQQHPDHEWQEGEERLEGPPLNLGSNKQLGKFLFETLGLTPVMFTKKTGAPAVSSEHMDLLDHPFCASAKELNQAEHLFGTYLVGTKPHVKSDGRLHPYPWLHGTVGGRRSYTEPAMQTFPQEYTVGPEWAKIKSIIVPTRPDFVLFEADYDQIEIWAGALLSGDPAMRADLETGDYHSRVAREVLKSEWPEGSMEFTADRQRAKVVTFSIMYLVEPGHLSKIVGCSEREAKVIISRWYARYYRFRAWQKEILIQARKKGYLETPFGYYRRFPWIPDNSLDKMIVNFPIQSCGGTLTLDSLIKLHQSLKNFKARVLLDVHDSLLFEGPRIAAREIVAEIKQVMQEPKLEGWPGLKVSVKAGDNWWGCKGPGFIADVDLGGATRRETEDEWLDRLIAA